MAVEVANYLTALVSMEDVLDFWCNNAHTHTHTHNHFMALWILSGTTRVSWYQKKHSPTHIHGILPVQSTCLADFFHNLSPSCLWSTSWPLVLATMLSLAHIHICANWQDCTCQPLLHQYLSNVSSQPWNSLLTANVLLCQQTVFIKFASCMTTAN